MTDQPVKQHMSDCAVHNEPAWPAGECNCEGYYIQAYLDKMIGSPIWSGFKGDSNARIR
jgi:hypothetical protein